MSGFGDPRGVDVDVVAEVCCAFVGEVVIGATELRWVGGMR